DGRNLGWFLGRHGDRLRRGWMNAAELFVVDEVRDCRVRAAHRAVRVFFQLELTELHPQRVEDQKPADQRLANLQNELDRFHRLNRADDSRQNTKYPAFGAARHETWRRRLRIQAAIARTCLQPEYRRLPFEPENAAIRVRFVEQHA